jgi:hypothetical protein
MHRRTSSLAALLALAAACTPVAVSRPSGPAAKAPPAPEARVAPASVPAPSTSNEPDTGSDPSASALAEARLVPSSCEIHKAAKEARLAQMHREVDAEFKRWHDLQPACWEEDRRREAERKAMEECMRGGECSGRGLSGVGEGGGGHGEGIGLGNVGTLGHGASTATSASRTNNQVAGVDEADIVKTDGRYVYMVANGALRIVEAMNPRLVSVTRLPGVVREMLVEGDRAVVFTADRQGTERCTYGYDCTVGGDGTTTRIDVFDITNRSAPQAIRKVEFTGSLMAARRIGTTIHTVVADGDDAVGNYEVWPKDLPECGTNEPVVRAKFAALRRDNEKRIKAATSLPSIVERGVTTPLCAGLLDNKFDQVHTFTSLVSFDMRDARAPISSATVRSRPGTVFASTDALYMSTQRRKKGSGRWYSFYPSVDEVSELHKFRIGAKPTDTRYVGSGVVPGHVLNQFAMDEWNGHLRVATTRGKVPDPNVESAVSVFSEGAGGNLVRVGAVEHLARGEDVRAVRFDDDRGYLVTFKKTDPLFVLDLHDAARPTVLGELKIPGFSTYLHRLDPTHLLSIGFDANDHGDFAYFDGVLLQLFDVTKPTEPKLLHREKLGTRGSSSAALTNHLAFNYFAEKGLLAIPMTMCEGGSDGVNGTELSFAGLMVYRVDVKRGFERLGGVAHGKKGSNCDTWWSKATSAVKRSVFLDDLVYSMALDRVKVQRMGAFGQDLADISLTQ